MNRGQLNGFALNGQVADPVVRVRVSAKGFAVGRAQGRVLAYAVVAAKARAQQSGAIGRVEANLSVEARARAAALGILGKVDIHGVLQATGRAIIKVTLPPVYGRVRSKPKAQIDVAAHAMVRSSLVSSGKAKASATARLLRRGPVSAKPATSVHADGQIYIRRWLRSPAISNGVAFIVSNSRVEARLASLTQAKAVAVVNAHAMRRSPIGAQGVAVIEIDFEIHKRLPFDEQAPEYRTFIVPAGQFSFTVTE